jgi:hypothetical protein
MVPQFKKPNVYILWGGLGVLVIAIAAAILAITTHSQQQENVSLQTNTSTDRPDFEAALPANKTIESLGGWQKLTPPSGDDYFVFVDQLDGIPIKVSQQPLPDSFSTNVDAYVLEAAKGYNATNTFDANGTTAYHGTSAQGPQSVIFTKSGLLVLIVSDAKIQDSSWISYISSLD